MPTTDFGPPPIVLFVGLPEAEAGYYSAAFEAAGFWVAAAASLRDALRDIVDLKPDAVVADLTSTREPGPQEFVRTLKNHSRTSAVPVVVLQEAAGDQEPLRHLGPLDMRVAKPVSVRALREGVERAIAASRDRRERTPDPAEPIATSVEPRPSRGPARSTARTCPSCARPLEWVERAVVAGIEYDYYRWCERGCGLFCFKLDDNDWVKLA